ncbi:two-component system sensor histidine kinase RegB [Rhodobacter aestuarii]|uniref:histidine kinase n=1 Tax=Rhodobacter aestuarii TaxID=453582 RepID=A0A1N7LH72_9RHOB|nr:MULTISPECIES: ActS/PrrB/RegB family redox-sensitive histidine kinase [Rhodobacter]PTV95257.1 two-component system sensor histidine kinase RegB [Rhodobacter aestuarii]SIS73126.1 two-component system, sensor histidine kinase RegB [Rhodobacter aestuarii]SOC08045.1 two-component system sensor histidine kinase RegB [Rhodobacter sp. JA431]
MADLLRAPERVELDISATLSHQEWVRVRTLILLRWAAIFGQLAALVAAHTFFNIELNLPLCLITVGAAVVANIAAINLYPESRRLSQVEVTTTLLFDTAQLALLLTLTGGLNNPFALLILVPVTIAATALKLRPTLLLGGATILMITLVALVAEPLSTHDGELITVPMQIEFGTWVAIVIGVIFLGAYAHRIAQEIHSMSDALFATQLALSREQKLTDLGGVVAAAAHELGTPLATIKLVSSELADELSDDPELFDDAVLIRDQADRCRDILRSMGRAGKDDVHLRTAPLLAVLREAAEPHMERGKNIYFDCVPGEGGSERQPTIYRYPELVHALRNLVQNAVDFAQTTVWVDAQWTDRSIIVRVSDDGRGYAPSVINRIGDPFISSRGSNKMERPEYEGMGLGLFIAKTLLERTGAKLRFSNGTEPYQKNAPVPRRSGAMVELRWHIGRLLAPEAGPLGENVPIQS